MNQLPKTVFCDIDGVLIEHKGDILTQHRYGVAPLTAVKERFREWDAKGYRIILISGRRECARRETEIQLADADIIYDQLIMGLGGGDRILINDKKPDGRITAFAFSPDRNSGLAEVNI